MTTLPDMCEFFGPRPVHRRCSRPATHDVRQLRAGRLVVIAACIYHARLFDGTGFGHKVSPREVAR